jgi:hypothetical protein
VNKHDLIQPTLAYNNINKFTDACGTISAMLWRVCLLEVFDLKVGSAEASH